MPKNRWFFAVAAACLCAGGADLARGAVGRYAVKSFDKAEGLPRSSVLAMTQTRDGYLWLGTGRGLVRFDGTQFTLFNENNTPGLNGQLFVKLFEDSHTNLWIGTQNAGVLLVRNGVVTNLDIGRAGAEGHLVAACEDASGAVWLSTHDERLYRYRAGQVQAVNAQGCHALIAEDSGLIWIALRGSGANGGNFDTLYGLGPFTESMGAAYPVACQLPVGKLDYLLASARGGYWRLANGRIEKWRKDRLERDWGAYPWDAARAVVSAACEDDQGNPVVATYGDGVYWCEAPGRWAHLSSELATSFIFSLTMDREGCLWVGTDGQGLKRVRPQVFEVLEKSRGLTINSVCADTQGGLWFAINNGGVDFWKNGQLKEFKEPEGLDDLYVRTIFVDREQKVWAGTQNRGLFQLQEGRFRPAPGYGKTAAKANVSALFQDRRGILWVGTQGGLARWEGSQWKVMTIHDGLSANEVQALAEDAEGSLWVGTRAGLNRVREGKVATFGKSQGLPGESISELYVDGDGVLWVGTSGGLARYLDGKWTDYASVQGLDNDAVDYLMEDANGYLWIDSTSGLARVLKKDLDNFASGLTNNITLRRYGTQDGLPTTEYSSDSQPAAWRTDQGVLWFPTTRGLVSLNPSQLVPNTNPPPVVIESVKIQDQMLSTNSLRAPPLRSVTMPAGKERLEIHYTCLSPAAADRVRFRYRLEGYESGWTPADSNIRVVFYSKLPQGHYYFHVQACNEDGVWNPSGCTLEVTVLPPFWQTWWFLAIVSAGLLGLIVGSVHYASTQRLQRQVATLRQQEALELERARIARDLHDQLGANLTQVALLGEMAETDKDLPGEVATHARQISHTARETTRALDEIVWTVNPSNDTLDGLVTYICKYAQDYLALAGLRYRIEAPSQLPAAPISPEFRHNVFLVAKEAVNNIVKHARASSVWLRLHLEPGRFTLELEDDGRGLSVGDENKGRNGLRNMRRRMADIGGEIRFDSGKGGGTVVRLTAPVTSQRT